MINRAGWLFIVLAGIAITLLPAACAPAPIAATPIVPSLSHIAELPTLIPTRAAVERAPTNTREVRPTETEKPVTLTRAVPTPTITFAPHFDHVWEKFPAVAIVKVGLSR